MENSMEIPQKIKNRNTVRSSSSTFGEWKWDLKEISAPHVHYSIIHNSQGMETT